MVQQKGNVRHHRKHKRSHQHLRVVKEAWRPVGESIVTGSKHAARADLKQTAKEALTFVVAFIKAMYMTAVTFVRMAPWVSP